MAGTRAERAEAARALKPCIADEDRDGWEPMPMPPLPELPTQLGLVFALMIPKGQ